ncbi:MAG: hypothetical protein R3C10_17980 [Pirellulales bacterium]
MTDPALDEMRQLLAQMDRLEQRVVSLQRTVATFRGDVERDVTAAQSGPVQSPHGSPLAPKLLHRQEGPRGEKVSTTSGTDTTAPVAC